MKRSQDQEPGARQEPGIRSQEIGAGMAMRSRGSAAVVVLALLLVAGGLCLVGTWIYLVWFPGPPLEEPANQIY